MDWMCERAGLMEQSSQSVQPNSVSLEPAENAPVADLRIRIGELELAEALAEREVGGAEAGRHMRAQIHFELLSDESQLEPAGASYTFELLACEQASQQSLILASAGRATGRQTPVHRACDVRLPAGWRLSAFGNRALARAASRQHGDWPAAAYCSLKTVLQGAFTIASCRASSSVC